MRIAVGGMGTESCTFSPLPTRLADFFVARGPEILEGRGGYDLSFLSQFDATFIPTLAARALPGGPIEASAYEQLKGELLERLREAVPVDGVYLSLHGAMYVQGMEDAEGDLLAAVRAVIGPDCLLSASFDLHGNVSQRVAEQLDMLTAFRTAPHIDAQETREKAVRLLVHCLRENLRPHCAWIRVPVALPGEKTSTEWEPGASVYGFLAEVDKAPGVLDASLLVGYAWADEPRNSAAAVVTGTDPAVNHREAARIAQRYWDARRAFDFGSPAGSINECIGWALGASEPSVFISDSGDNPTAGAPGDLPIFLKHLLAWKVPSAVVAAIPDAEVVRACQAAGVGATVNVALGGKLDSVHAEPLPVTGQVLHLGVGEAAGGREGGAQAVLQIDNVKVIVTERRTPIHHIAQFQALGIEPLEHKLVVIKIGYLEPDLKRAAPRALLALSPGAVDQDITRLPFDRVQRPLYPLDPDMTWAPPAR